VSANSESRLIRALFALIAFAPWAQVAHGASVFVTDEIAVGLHEQRQFDSPVVRLVRSGAELEVLERDGALLRVRTRSGEEGWIDASYTTAQAPVAAQLRTAASTNEALHAELSALRSETERLKSDLLDSEESRKHQIGSISRALEGQVEAAREELNTVRESQLAAVDEADAERASERAKRTRLAAENKRLRRVRAASVQTSIPSGTLRELQRLAEENQFLKNALARSNEAPAPLQAESPEKPHPIRAPSATDQWLAFSHASPFALAVMGFGALLLASVGAWLQDLITRRRHGGFRL
jgi:hypothetical protein